MKCLLCNADAHRHACDPCIKRIRQWLRWTELYTTWLHMPHMLTPTRGQTGRRQPGYASRPPARLEALVMLDKRSTQGTGEDDDEHDAYWSILGTLHGLAAYLRQIADHSPPRQITLAGETGYLLAHIDWAANHPWIDNLAADIHNLHDQTRNQCKDRPESCGTCLQISCEGQVFWMLTRDRSEKARCVLCGHSYTGMDLVRLGAKKEAAG